MINAPRVAVLDGVENLKKDLPGLVVVTQALPAFCDTVEQVAIQAALYKHILAVNAIDSLANGCHVGVR